MVADTKGNQSVERAWTLLAAFTHGRSELRMTDVATQSGLGASTTSRLLATLERLGAVERDPVTGLFRLGLATIRLGGIAINQIPVYREARVVAQALAAQHGLGSNVAIRHGATLFYLLNVEGSANGKAYTMMGQASPLYATALGKCLLLDVPPQRRRELIADEELTSFTQNTITSHERLDQELDQVRNRSYATEVEELALGRSCIAAPIRARDGSITGALSLSGALSTMRLGEREPELAQIIIESADRISIGLGYFGPPLRNTPSPQPAQSLPHKR